MNRLELLSIYQGIVKLPLIRLISLAYKRVCLQTLHIYWNIGHPPGISNTMNVSNGFRCRFSDGHWCQQNEHTCPLTYYLQSSSSTWFMRSPTFELERASRLENLCYYQKIPSKTDRKDHQWNAERSPMAQINQYLFIYRFQAFRARQRQWNRFHACNRTVNRFHSRVNMY